MSLVQLTDVSLAYGHVPLLEHANLVLEKGERVCLIGRNGTGKSTLLKLIAGQATADAGEVRMGSSVRVAYLPQEPLLAVERTVYEVVAEGLADIHALLLDYHRASVAVAAAPTEPARLDALQAAQQRLEQAHAWDAQRQIETTLSLLDLPADTPIAELSGGWRRRVALGRALVAQPDVLLLDEPTNHLDIDTIEWLEQRVREFRGVVLFVSHDRAFLDRLATRIVELDRGMLRAFPGSYAQYQKHKADQLAVEAREQALFDKRLAAEEVWIRKGVEARRTRNEGRVRALLAMRERRAQRRTQPGKAQMSVDSGTESGQLVLEAEHVDFGYTGQPVVRDFSLRVLRGDRIGLIGPNGVGKTTLLRLLLKQLEPARGSVRHGTRLQIAYFDQHRAALDPEARVVDCVGEGRETVSVNGKSRHVMSYLGDFLFAPERARSPVKSLSGGERNRLLLARLFAQPTNLIVLDEPTNDLDIETLELLEDVLMDYSGTLFVVSHDRAFLDNVVTSCLAFEGEGRVNEYIGGYTDWLRQRPASAPRSEAADIKPKREKARPAAKKLSYKESRELAGLPSKIEALEQEQAALHAQLADPGLYANGGDAVRVAQQRLEAIEGELACAYARWEELETARAASL